jgi:large repetitive protein
MTRRLFVVLGVVCACSVLLAAPEIRAVFPDHGSSGDQVTIVGKNFSADKAQDIVKFGDAVAEVLKASAGCLSVTVPTLDPGDYPVTVTVKTETTEETSQEAITFTVFKAGEPFIEKIKPQKGPVGTCVALCGENLGTFNSPVTVLFGAVEVPTTSFRKSIFVRVPETLPLGDVAVSVKVGDVQSNSVTFTVIEIPPPVIEGIHPTTGPAGKLVTITGQDLSPRLGVCGIFCNRNGKGDGGQPAAKVFFGTDEAKVIYSCSRAIGAVVPAVAIPEGATEVEVDVTVVVGTGLTSNAVKFTVVQAPAPVVESLSPESGPVGTYVSIKGSNLGGTFAEREVLFGDTPATSVELGFRRSKIVAAVPEGLAVGTQYAVTVKVNGVAATLAEGAEPLVFTVEALPAPAIDSIDPTTGPVGTRVKIKGTNFRYGALEPKVFFNDIEAKAAWGHHGWGHDGWGFGWGHEDDGDAVHMEVLIVSVPEGLVAGVAAVKVVLGGVASETVDFTVTVPEEPNP